MCLGNLFISTISFKPINVVINSISKVAKVTKLNESKIPCGAWFLSEAFYFFTQVLSGEFVMVF
jgi:hypothetical protein